MCIGKVGNSSLNAEGGGSGGGIREVEAVEEEDTVVEELELEAVEEEDAAEEGAAPVLEVEETVVEELSTCFKLFSSSLFCSYVRIHLFVSSSKDICISFYLNLIFQIRQ